MNTNLQKIKAPKPLRKKISNKENNCVSSKKENTADFYFQSENNVKKNLEPSFIKTENKNHSSRNVILKNSTQDNIYANGNNHSKILLNSSFNLSKFESPVEDFSNFTKNLNNFQQNEEAKDEIFSILNNNKRHRNQNKIVMTNDHIHPNRPHNPIYKNFMNDEHNQNSNLFHDKENKNEFILNQNNNSENVNKKFGTRYNNNLFNQ